MSFSASGLSLIPMSDYQGFGLPKLNQTQGMLDQLKGKAPATKLSQGQALEATAAMALGAGLAGAARAQGWNEGAIGAIGAAMGVYAITSGQPTLMHLAHGLLAPSIARWAEQTWTPEVAQIPGQVPYVVQNPANTQRPQAVGPQPMPRAEAR